MTITTKQLKRSYNARALEMMSKTRALMARKSSLRQNREKPWEEPDSHESEYKGFLSVWKLLLSTPYFAYLYHLLIYLFV